MEKNREKEQQGPKNVTLKTFVSRWQKTTN